MDQLVKHNNTKEYLQLYIYVRDKKTIRENIRKSQLLYEILIDHKIDLECDRRV